MVKMAMTGSAPPLADPNQSAPHPDSQRALAYGQNSCRLSRDLQGLTADEAMADSTG